MGAGPEWAGTPPGGSASPALSWATGWSSASKLAALVASSAWLGLASTSIASEPSTDSSRALMSPDFVTVVISLRSRKAPTSNNWPIRAKHFTRWAGGNSSSRLCCTSCCTNKAFNCAGVRCFSASRASLYASTSAAMRGLLARRYGSPASVAGVASALYTSLYAWALVEPRAIARANSFCLWVKLGVFPLPLDSSTSTGIWFNPSWICCLVSFAGLLALLAGFASCMAFSRYERRTRPQA